MTEHDDPITAGGMLLVMMEPPASLEEEFNDWYDTEHFPQRAALPGFVSASRWTCVEGWPKWLALYDLESVGSLNSAAYAAVSGPNSTPWSKRLLPRTVGRRRIVGTALDSDQCSYGNIKSVPQQLLFCWQTQSPGLASELASSVRVGLKGFDSVSALRIVTRFVEDCVEVWAVIGLRTLSSPQHILQVIEDLTGNARPVLFNRYVPYTRFKS